MSTTECRRWGHVCSPTAASMATQCLAISSSLTPLCFWQCLPVRTPPSRTCRGGWTTHASGGTGLSPLPLPFSPPPLVVGLPSSVTCMGARWQSAYETWGVAPRAHCLQDSRESAITITITAGSHRWAGSTPPREGGKGPGKPLARPPGAPCCPLHARSTQPPWYKPAQFLLWRGSDPHKIYVKWQPANSLETQSPQVKHKALREAG